MPASLQLIADNKESAQCSFFGLVGDDEFGLALRRFCSFSFSAALSTFLMCGFQPWARDLDPSTLSLSLSLPIFLSIHLFLYFSKISLYLSIYLSIYLSLVPLTMDSH